MSGTRGFISGKARFYAERVNRAIIRHMARRRVQHGKENGERSPASIARPAAELVEISERDPHGRLNPITDHGRKTARRKMPAVLSRMDPQDGRRLAALSYADAIEQVGSMPGASLEGVNADGGPGSSDGGATTRIQFVQLIRAVHRACEFMTDDKGKIDRFALAPKSKRGNRRAIGWRELVDAVCIDGRDMRGILVAAGWSGHRREISELIKRAELMLAELACIMGLASPYAVRFGTS